MSMSKERPSGSETYEPGRRVRGRRDDHKSPFMMMMMIICKRQARQVCQQIQVPKFEPIDG